LNGDLLKLEILRSRRPLAVVGGWKQRMITQKRQKSNAICF